MIVPFRAVGTNSASGSTNSGGATKPKEGPSSVRSIIANALQCLVFQIRMDKYEYFQLSFWQSRSMSLLEMYTDPQVIYLLIQILVLHF